MINRRYSPLQKLASQAGRTTYLAKDLQDEKLVIIKEYRFDEANRWETFKMFDTEARILESLSHPSIPRYLDYLVSERGFCLVIEYIVGVLLTDFLEFNQTFYEFQLKQIAEKILEILGYLHGLSPAIIHGNIKPNNILVAQMTALSVEKVFLIGFSAAQMVGNQDSCTAKGISDHALPASDLYALGVTLIYLATANSTANSLIYRRLELAESTNFSQQFKDWLEKLSYPMDDGRFKTATEAFLSIKF